MDKYILIDRDNEKLLKCFENSFGKLEYTIFEAKNNGTVDIDYSKGFDNTLRKVCEELDFNESNYVEY